MTFPLKAMRRRAALMLSPNVAAAANMSLENLQQFIAGTYHPDEKQLKQLARRMNMTEEKVA